MKWNIEHSKYKTCFMPLVGMAIGFLMYLFSMFCQRFGFGQPCFALLGAVLPVLLSGGIPLAGFMKTADALSTPKVKEKRLEQMQKGQTGVYGMIAIACYFMLYAGGLILIWKERHLFLLGMGYIISRILSGMAEVWFPFADGEKVSFGKEAKQHKQNLRAILVTVLALCFVLCIFISPILGILEALACMWVWTYYYYMSKSKFGGITKETTGYFQSLCELAVVLLIGIIGRIW
ncbi:MAG: adenosylcobinamide-GDP ribazoletransferase [Lachnospiraceae bacterium]|nr:adenosylcobinamide-GDP ribazoletransferase [Lachnospiraceae bacterium]